jgi:uncharacterized protein (TIGR03083 family)
MTSTCHRLEPQAYCELLSAETERFITAISRFDPDESVPSCPGWTIHDLVAHTGGLHRWAEAHMRSLSQLRVDPQSLELDVPDEASGFPGWLHAGVARLIEATVTADPDAPVWAWGSDKKVRFWPRRMLFETTIHRADAELTEQRTPAIATSVAVDGCDEFLDNLPYAAYFAPRVEDLRGRDETLLLHARDTDTSWAIRLLPDRFTWGHSLDDPPQASIEGSAPELLLLLYGRADLGSFSVRGDQYLVGRWLKNSAI